MTDFADLLRGAGLDRGNCAYCLHKMGDPVRLRAVQSLVEDRPDLFEAFQANHPAGPEATVRDHPLFAAFVQTAPGEATFVGLYDRVVGPPQSAADWLSDPAIAEMVARVDGHVASPETQAAKWAGRLRFQFTPRAELADLSRRLVVADPGGRAYVRLGQTTDLPVLEIGRRASLVPPLPAWDRLVLTKADLRTLPAAWDAALGQWRGVYLLVDEADGARYVGSAYGTENLLGRWRSHVAGTRGVTEGLRDRNPATFRFSILELTAPTAPPEEVIRLEQTWMDRLHTRAHGLNAGAAAPISEP